MGLHCAMSIFSTIAIPGSRLIVIDGYNFILFWYCCGVVHRLALIQLAVSCNVFLLDMLALSNILVDDDWRQLVERVFCGEEFLIVGVCCNFQY